MRTHFQRRNPSQPKLEHYDVSGPSMWETENGIKKHNYGVFNMKTIIRIKRAINPTVFLSSCYVTLWMFAVVSSMSHRASLATARGIHLWNCWNVVCLECIILYSSGNKITTTLKMKNLSPNRETEKWRKGNNIISTQWSPWDFNFKTRYFQLSVAKLINATGLDKSLYPS